MRTIPFRKDLFPAFKAMLSESKSEFRQSWARHISGVYRQGAKSSNGASNFAVLEKGRLAAVFSTRREVQAFVLYFLMIKREFQGKGIGTAIVRKVELMAKKAGASFIRLDAYPGKKAILFYKKMGFKYGGRVKYYEEAGDDQRFFYKKIK